MTACFDIVIFGGGGAGLWLLDEVRSRGHRAVLLEADRLGAGQTICAQGIIHGGLKYTLDGVLSKSASAIRDMPQVWRACLDGRRVPNLHHTRVRAGHCYLWRTASIRARLGMVGARVGLRVAPETVADDHRPAVLAGCPGEVATIAEPVIDPASFVAGLARRHGDALLKIDAEHGLDFTLSEPGQIEAIRLTDPAGGLVKTLMPHRVVFTAGAGNAALCARVGLAHVAAQQLRPLHMLLMRGPLPELNGHCVEGAHTLVTITSDADAAGRTVWQVGGQVAEDGAAMDRPEFLRHAAAQVRAALPGLELGEVEFSAYRVDRAEAAASGHRPSDVYVGGRGNVLVAWPTKLALVPRLAHRIAAELDFPTPGRDGAAELDGWPRPEPAQPPWEWQQQWTTDV